MSFELLGLESFVEAYSNMCDARDLVKVSIIRKVPGGWGVFSEKGKHLGKYKTKQEAVKRLRQIEFFKHKKKKASNDSDLSYSSVMRSLRKSYSDEVLNKFREEYKKNFDEAILNNEEEPEKIALHNSLEILKNIEVDLKKTASAIDLGDPEYAGKYLADLIKFVMRRISPERRQKSLESLRKKVYYINEYDISSKKVPPSAAMGQSITLLKHMLLDHDPKYIRAVLNSITRHLG